MFYHLLMHYQPDLTFLRVFRYITFRSLGAVLTALALSFLLGPYLIRRLSLNQIGQQIRDDGPVSHLRKAGTPTMGGVLVLFCGLLATFLWARLDTPYVWLAIAAPLCFGLIGLVDDVLKLKRKSSKGLSAGGKMRLQVAAALLIGLFFCAGELSLHWPFRFLAPAVGKIFPVYTTDLQFPFLKQALFSLGLFYVLFIAAVLVAASNAVNITDGLDGLAIGPVMVAMLTFAVLAYASGHLKIAEYLNIPYLAGSGELSVVAAAVFGASLGFLWFNTYPAQVFMGDVGSLSLGGLLGLLAVATKNELLLVLIGGVFVLETLSVIIQVASYKLSGHRVFRMAPLHHHFELKGWAEPKVIVRFWIVSIILALLALSTLKLR